MKARLIGMLTAVIAIGTIVGGFVIVQNHKSVTLQVDGESMRVSGFMGSVGDVLKAAGVDAGPRDAVIPSASAAVADGDFISFRYARPVEVTRNGLTTTHWTTERTLQDAFRALGVAVSADDRLSEPASRSLGREGLSVTITSPKDVTITVGGTPQKVTTHAATVADLLDELTLTVGTNDRLSVAATTALEQGATVTLDRVKIKDVTRTEAVKFATTRQNDDSIYKGTTKTVTKGVAGSRTITEKVTIVNGTTTTTTTLSSVVTKQPTDAVVKVGTKALPAGTSSSGKALNLANAAMWDKIAQCESSGRWNINTGNGYYGGLQFNLATWRSVKGGDFAVYPHQASRAEQITVANRLYAKRGLQPWSCRRVL